MSRYIRSLSAVAVVILGLSGCTSVISGTGVSGLPAKAPDATVAVVGDSKSKFDTIFKNGIADVEAFWKKNYSKVSGGKEFKPIQGKYWSVEGENPGREATEGEACLGRDDSIAIDNAFFCRLDDSIVWDRDPKHLVAVLGDKYGEFLVAMVVAHEFGHAIQQRLGIFDSRPDTILTESQADCAAGAFTKAMLDFQTPHFFVSPAQLDTALNGYLQVRDETPDTVDEVASGHGNGFDRISAVADGVDKGVEYCFSDGYFKSRQFTERPFATDEDYAAGGNLTFEESADPAGILIQDLNRFWKKAATSIGKEWKDVKLVEADSPKCGGEAASEFAYCPDDNTVYHSKSIAQKAYFSLTKLNVDRRTFDASLAEGQAADFALGTLYALGWGMAVRHQLFNAEITDQTALKSGICYVGAYSKDINIKTDPTKERHVVLSPPDMDEATSAMLNLIDDQTFGARGTTGLHRVQDFTKGYAGGLSVC